MKHLLLALLFSINVQAKTIKIAVIDSGLTATKGLKLCNNIIDFTHTNTDAEFKHHGDNIAHIIGDGLSKQDYCLYILKAFTEDSKNDNLRSSTAAIAYAIEKQVDIINMSAGGSSPDIIEKALVLYAISKKIKFVAAAGNDDNNLDEMCNYFPICYSSSVIGVANLENDGTREHHSNYGRYVRVWKKGTNITAGGVTMTGTSQSAAVESRELLINMLKVNK